MKRIRLSVRMMLLLVALLSVLCAWAVTVRNARRALLRAEILQFEMMRKAPTDSSLDKKRMFGEIDAEIAKRQKILGEN